MNKPQRCDLVLIFPRLKYPSGDPPLGLASIAAAVRQAGYGVVIVDATWHRDVRWVCDEVERLDPEWVGIYCSTLMLQDASRIAGRLRLLQHLGGRKRKLVVGGPHLTIRPEDNKFLYANYVVKGEGEQVMLDLLAGKSGPHSRPDLLKLPPPALDLLEMDKYIAHWHYFDPLRPGWRGTNLLSSRGCPWHCTYCQPTLDDIFGKKLRRRTPEQICEEMEDQHARYGIDSWFFHDDTFTVQRDWLQQFFQATEQMTFYPFFGINARADTLDEDLVHALAVHGLRVCHLGIEAASERIRNDLYEKKITLAQIEEAVRLLRKYRVAVGGFFMLGAPGETRAEIQATVDLACSLSLDEASFSLTVPLPGTFLHDRLCDSGATLTRDTSRYDYYGSQPFEHELGLTELKKIQRRALLRFYGSRKGYLLKHLMSLGGLRHLRDKVGRFM